MLPAILVGLACRTLGDEDTAVLDLKAAREVFSRLRARPDVARVDALLRSGASPTTATAQK